MLTYKVTFELVYPESDSDVKTAYVLADSFKDAEYKTLGRYKKEFERAYVMSMEMLNADIII